MSDPADENLLENPFFLGLGSHFPLLISKLVHQEGWKCVVPASGSWNNRPKKKPRSEDWTYQEFATHILVPTARNHQFKNLLDQPVWIRGDRIFGSDPDEADPGGLVPAAVRILFQETYYDDEDRKFNLICVDRPLPMDFSSAPSPELEGNPLRLETFQDCHNFLRAEPEALQILKILDEASRAIKKGKISSKDLKELYSKTVRELMAKCPKIGEKSQKCRPFFQHLRKGT